MENRRTISAAESYNHGLTPCETFAFMELFFSSYIKNTSLTPQTYVGRVCRDFFSEFQHCVGWGDGKLQENFEKDALFREGTEK